MTNAKLETYSNEESEKGVLGCCLIDPQTCVFKIFDQLGADAVDLFYSVHYRQIWIGLLDLVTDGGKPDILQLVMKLKQHDEEPADGWMLTITTLQDSVPSALNLDYYLDQARDALLKRKSGTLLTKAYADLVEVKEGVKSKLLELEGSLMNINQDQIGENLHHMPDQFSRTIEQLDNYKRGGPQLEGLETGYKFLDNKMGGLVKKELIIIAGRPGGGKTALGMNIVLNQVLNNEESDRISNAQGERILNSKSVRDDPKKCLVFSMEMTVKELASRVLFSHSGANMVQLRTGCVSDRDYARIVQSEEQLKKIPIWVDDRPQLTIAQITSKARQVQLMHGVDLILVDYLQLATSGRNTRYFDRQQEVAEVSKGLKALAKNLDVPVLALAQLNRNAAKSKHEPPSLSDLRESGQIEQDADFVGLLHEVIPRDEEEEKLMEGEDIFTKHCKLIIAKQRSGPTDDVSFKFHKSCVRFETFDYQEKGKFAESKPVKNKPLFDAKDTDW
tara:strand:+ start:2321 stop:3829 length:1509 start_codon:yes stop_codon:yes gene_type:complete